VLDSSFFVESFCIKSHFLTEQFSEFASNQTVIYTDRTSRGASAAQCTAIA
jgi:hypothetical protein